MLCELHIKNFTIIEDINLSFGNGLVVITGETGSGKTVLISALNLLLGGKSSRSIVRNGAAEAFVSGVFYPVQSLSEDCELKELGLNMGEKFSIQRKFTQNGRSKNTLNGKVVALAVLEKIGRHMIDIHGQHCHQDLLNTEIHLDYLDAYGKLGKLRNKVASSYSEYRRVNDSLHKLLVKQKALEENRELMEFQLREINDLAVKRDEDEELRREIKALKNASLVIDSLKSANSFLSGSGGVLEGSKQAARLLEKIEEFKPEVSSLRKRLDSICIELDDVSMELENSGRDFSEDPERLNALNERLFKIDELKRKYGCSIESLFEVQTSISEQLSSFQSYDEKKQELELELKKIELRLKEDCAYLYEQRKNKALELEKKIAAELESVAIRGARFEIEFEPLKPPRFSARGSEKCAFWFSANEGINLEPLKNVASGGELSRIMLSIKSVCLAKEKPPHSSSAKKTLVFDEIDTGIGGETATVVGEKLKDLSKKNQLICITHLPQIAAYGTSHLMVSKKVFDNRTFLDVKNLAEEERVQEIGRMLGGNSVGHTAIEHARQMLRIGKE